MYQRITERCLKLAIMAGANAANNANHIVVERCTRHGSMTSSFMRQPLPTGAPSFDRTARRNEGSIRPGAKTDATPIRAFIAANETAPETKNQNGPAVV